MKNNDQDKTEKVWRWCPVCMSNQDFEWIDGELKCTHRKHHHLLHNRKDSWIKTLPEWKALQREP